MDIKVGDVITLKKPHPCGGTAWTVLRIGADFRIRCNGCGREVMRPRTVVERSIRKLSRPEQEQNQG